MKKILLGILVLAIPAVGAPYTVESSMATERCTIMMQASVMETDVDAALETMFTTLDAFLEDSDVETAGPAYVRYISTEPDFTVEAGFTVTPCVEGDGEVLGGKLPAGPVLSTVHKGSFDALGDAYTALDQHIGGTDLDVVGPVMEEFLTEDDVPEAEQLIRVTYPVGPATK